MWQQAWDCSVCQLRSSSPEPEINAGITGVAGGWSSPVAPLELLTAPGSLAGDEGVESRSHLARIAGSFALEASPEIPFYR